MLSPDQIAARKDRLGGSDMRVIMEGDAQGIYDLYLEKIGEKLPDDLSLVWPVQLGIATEELNLRWYAMKQGDDGRLTRHGEVVVHPQYPWAAVTLDAWDELLGCPVEAKCVGGRQPLEVILDRYAPQTQFQMACTGATTCAITIIFGGNEPVIEYLDRDDAYIAEMIRRGRNFMACVKARQAPVTLPPVPPPAPDAKRIVDMSGSEEWCRNADVWKQSWQAAASAKDAEKVLKSLVEADVAKAFGHGCRITRDRAGRLSLREED